MTERDGQQVSSRTAFSATWLLTSRLMTKGIDFVLLLLLARLLMPGDFGLVAIAMTLILIVESVLELPVIQVIVRLPELEPAHFDTAFTLSAVRGLFLAGLLAALALPFADLYGDGRLLPLIMVLSLAPVARGLLSPRLAVFARQLDYRRDFLIEVVGKLSAFAIATVLAFATHSYWAIALGTVATPVMMMIVSYALAPYRPRLSLFDWRAFAGFLGWTSSAQFITAINWQCDRLILAHYVSRPSLGQFSMANDLSSFPQQALIKPILRPLIAAFALMAHDLDRLRHAYERSAATVLAAGMPFMIGLSTLADPAVRFALGAKWLPAVPILQILSLTLLPPLFAAPLPPLAIAMGRTGIFLRQSLVELVVKLPIIAAGAALAGIEGVVIARLCSATIMALVSLLYVRQLIGSSLARQIMAAWRVLAGGAVLAMVMLIAEPMMTALNGPMLGLAIVAAAGVGMLCYGLTMMGLWRMSGCPAGVETIVARAFDSVRRRLTSGRATKLRQASID